MVCKDISVFLIKCRPSLKFLSCTSCFRAVLMHLHEQQSLGEAFRQDVSSSAAAWLQAGLYPKTPRGTWDPGIGVTVVHQVETNQHLHPSSSLPRKSGTMSYMSRSNFVRKV